jgi:hypothetical protein
MGANCRIWRWQPSATSWAPSPITDVSRCASTIVCIIASTTTQVTVRKNMMARPTTRRRH